MEKESHGCIQLSQVMATGPYTVEPGTSLDEACALMDRYAIRHLPVLDGGRLVGVVSDRDLLEATGWLPTRLMLLRERALPTRSLTAVEDVMRRAVHTARPEDDLLEAAMGMLSRSIGCLPVLEGERLVGIVTEMDVLQAVAGLACAWTPGPYEPDRVEDHMTGSPTEIHWYATLQDATDICRANGIRHLLVVEAGRLAGMLSDRDLRRAVGVGRHEELPVSELMTREVVTARPEEPIADAARRMLAERISALPVLHEGRVVGILTLSDLLDLFLDRCMGVAGSRRWSAPAAEEPSPGS